MTPRTGRALATLGALALVGGTALAAQAGAASTARSIEMRGLPAVERVVVTFAGDRIRATGDHVEALDPNPGDGRASVRVRGPGIASAAAPAARDGVGVRIASRPGSVVALVTAPPGRFKFVSYRVAGGNRLVVDLWRATTDRRATRLDDRCLRLTAWRGGAAPAVTGLELRPLFEHNVVTSLRAENAGGRTISLQPRIATGFRFRPDFSGYIRPGRFGGPLPHSLTTPRRAMLEAWSTSARDGSLECLVQVPVQLTPRS